MSPRIMITNLDELTESHDLETSADSPRTAMWPVSNEGYGRRIGHFIKSTKIDRYLGVCGGGTQNLYLLSLLQENNGLRSVELVDRSPMQLRNLVDIITIYNDTSDSAEYTDSVLSHIRESRFVPYCMNLAPVTWKKHPASYYASCGCDWCRVNMHRPRLKGDLKLTIKKADIRDKALIDGSGRYFVYLSNVHDQMSKEQFHSLLDVISANRKVEDRSIVFQSFYGKGYRALTKLTSDLRESCLS